MPVQAWDEYGNPITDDVEAWDENGRPIRAHIVQQAPPRRRQTPMQTASGAIATFGGGTFLNFHDELSGATSGALDALGEIGQQIGLGRRGQGGVGAAYMRGYRRQVDRMRADREGFREEHPRIAAFTEGSGGTIPVIMTMGAATPEVASAQVAQRAPGLITRTAQGASIGSVYGAATGFGGSDGDLSERMDAGADAAALGSAVGAVAPGAIKVLGMGGKAALDAARPGLRAAADVIERVTPLPRRNTFGAHGGNLGPPRRTPRPPPSERITIPQSGQIARMFERARMSADDVEAAAARARANPQGEVLADLAGDTGVRTVRPVVQSPGETGALAEELTAQRFQAAPDRIIAALRRTLRVSESRQAAIRRLNAEYDQMSNELYTPVLRQQLTPQQEQGLERAVAPYLDDPVFERAAGRAEQIFNRDRRNGLVIGGIHDSLPRYNHYLKLGLDAEIQKAPEGGRGLSNTEMRGVQVMRQRIVDALDANIPGYRQARERWAGTATAEEALSEGAEFLTMNSDEVAARVAEMTPFELTHARIGMADAISHSIGRSGKVVGDANVANSQLLNSPEGQRCIAAVFDTPEQAADFLGTVTAQNRLMRNATAWGGGSTTYSNDAYGTDGALAALAEHGADFMRGDAGRAFSRMGRQIGNLATNGAVERSNNQFGAQALRRIDGPEAKRFTDEVVRILREREQGRRINTAASAAVSAGAGQQAGRQRTDKR